MKKLYISAKNWRFSKKTCYNPIVALTLSILRKKWQIFVEFFSENSSWQNF
jgi:hypothetical protein